MIHSSGSFLKISKLSLRPHPATQSCASPNHTEIAKFLVKKGANVNHRNEGGFTPLMHVAYAGNVELVKFLLENGADANAKTANGKTPLIFAREKGGDDVVDLLRKHGSN